MKKWLIPIAALAAVAVFSRLPHPSRDIADLKPVRAVSIYMEGRSIHIKTDTGDSGAGPDLTEAYEALKSGADGEIFLDTAEFLILDPDVPITEETYEIFRPDCKVIFLNVQPDLEKAPDYLAQYPPKLTLAQLRAARTRKGADDETQTAYPLAPGRPGRAHRPFIRLRLADVRSGRPSGAAPCVGAEKLE